MSNLVLDDTVGEFGTRRGRKKDGGCGTGRNGKKEGKLSLRLQASGSNQTSAEQHQPQLNSTETNEPIASATTVSHLSDHYQRSATAELLATLTR
jgi:hypothetical protein